MCWTLWAGSSSANDETDTSIVDCSSEQLTVTRADSTWHGCEGRAHLLQALPHGVALEVDPEAHGEVLRCKQRLGSGWHCLLEMGEPWRGPHSLAASHPCPEPSQQPSAVALTRQPVEEAVCLGSCRKQIVWAPAPQELPPTPRSLTAQSATRHPLTVSTPRAVPKAG